ncbi:hypothetical protein PC128_g3492 [Phytophthora cactorum]|nr:hypothetical protein PC128_g3492 [Phytophthora cactorum]
MQKRRLLEEYQPSYEMIAFISPTSNMVEKSVSTIRVAHAQI